MKLILQVQEVCGCGAKENLTVEKELGQSDVCHMDEWEEEVERLANSKSTWKYKGMCPKCSEEYDAAVRRHTSREVDMKWNGSCWILK